MYFSTKRTVRKRNKWLVLWHIHTRTFNRHAFHLRHWCWKYDEIYLRRKCDNKAKYDNWNIIVSSIGRASVLYNSVFFFSRMRHLKTKKNDILFMIHGNNNNIMPMFVYLQIQRVISLYCVTEKYKWHILHCHFEYLKVFSSINKRILVLWRWWNF